MFIDVPVFFFFRCRLFVFYSLTHGVIFILEDTTGTNILSTIQASRLSSLLFFSEHTRCMYRNHKSEGFVVVVWWMEVFCAVRQVNKKVEPVVEVSRTGTTVIPWSLVGGRRSAV